MKWSMHSDATMGQRCSQWCRVEVFQALSVVPVVLVLVGSGQSGASAVAERAGLSDWVQKGAREKGLEKTVPDLLKLNLRASHRTRPLLSCRSLLFFPLFHVPFLSWCLGAWFEWMTRVSTYLNVAARLGGKAGRIEM